MERLSKEFLKILLFQKADDDWTPFHVAAVKGEIMLIIDFYTSLSLSGSGDGDGIEKSWLALTLLKKTPLNVALKCSKENETGAMQILLIDVELLSDMVDDDGTSSPMFLALQSGFTQVAETILMSRLPSAISFRAKMVRLLFILRPTALATL